VILRVNLPAGGRHCRGQYGVIHVDAVRGMPLQVAVTPNDPRCLASPLPCHGSRYSLPISLKLQYRESPSTIVVHQIDTHHHAGRRQPLRQLVIVGARRGIPRRMVVDNQDRRRNRSLY
jgi:hypothetical protein